MNKTLALLQQLGFSEYEARAYVALLRRNPLNGYELAKASELPRANVYAVLQKLEQRGAVVRVDTPDGVRYTPVPPGELTQNMGRHFQKTLDNAQRLLGEITAPPEREYVWNLQGYAALLEHARTLVEAAQERLFVAVWPPEALALAEHMARAEARGVKVTTLCLAACAQECGGCRGHLYRYQVAPVQDNRWLMLVPDRAEVLAGEIGPGEVAVAVRTHQPLLVELTKRYIRHSIALAAMLSDLGSRVEVVLRPETRAALETVSPGGPNGGWLEHMHQLLSRRRG